MNRTSMLLSLAFALTLGAVGVRLFEPSAPVVSEPLIPAARCVFNESQYLQLNPDVARAVANGDFLSGAQHFGKYGRGEGRAGALACEGMRTNERTDFDFKPCDFNEVSYLQMNPDVDAAVRSGAVGSGVAHYLRFGRSEGRRPNAACGPSAPPPTQGCVFNESEYLQLNPDVARAVARTDFASGAAHFASFGQGEGRAPAFNCGGMTTKDRTDFNFAPCDFNETSYLQMHPDVAAAVKRGAVESGVAHYLRFGRNEGRSPNIGCPKAPTVPSPASPRCAFNESEYLQLNPDVARAVGRGDFNSGATHFAGFGRNEGRAPAFDCEGMKTNQRTDFHFAPCDFNETSYLALHTDVAIAVKRGAVESGAAHYLRFGRQEGRRVSLACPEKMAPSPSPPQGCAFNESQYLMLNPDVARAVGLKQFASGAAHFERFGRGEGRAPAFNCPGTSSRDRADLKYDPCDYNETNYLGSNPDVAKAIARGAEASGVAHFLREGRRDERMPYGRCHFPSR